MAVKIFVPEALSTPLSPGVFARFASENGAELIVPHFFFISARTCSPVVAPGGLPVEGCPEHLRDLTVLGLYRDSGPELWPRKPWGLR